MSFNGCHSLGGDGCVAYICTHQAVAIFPISFVLDFFFNPTIKVVATPKCTAHGWRWVRSEHREKAPHRLPPGRGVERWPGAYILSTVTLNIRICS